MTISLFFFCLFFFASHVSPPERPSRRVFALPFGAPPPLSTFKNEKKKTSLLYEDTQQTVRFVPSWSVEGQGTCFAVGIRVLFCFILSPLPFFFSPPTVPPPPAADDGSPRHPP